MKKNNYEIIVSTGDYPKVLEVLNYLRLNYTDEFSLIQMPRESDAQEASSRLYGIIGVILGIIGAYIGIAFLFWTQRISYPLDIGGKHMFDFIYSVPVIFEFVVLFVVVGLFLVFIFSNRMFHFGETHTEKQSIYLENIYNIDIIKEKLKDFDVKIEKFA